MTIRYLLVSTALPLFPHAVNHPVPTSPPRPLGLRLTPMFNKLKQFKDIRDKAKQLQDMLGGESAEGASGWGKVKITVNGLQQVVSVAIDPSLASDIPKLQDLIKEAANDAMQNIQKKMALKMKDMGGLDLAKDLQDMVQQGGDGAMAA